MNNVLRSALVVTACSVVMACVEEPAEEVGARSDLVTLGSATLTCRSLRFSRGSATTDEDVQRLATRELQGSADQASAYIGFSGSADATCSYALPDGMSPSSVGGLTLQTNYRGPAASTTLWRFSVWDYVANEWVVTGSNEGFVAKTWTPASFPMRRAASRFVSETGKLKVRFYARARTSSTSASLDELVLVMNAGAPSPSPTPDPSTPPPNPEPAPAPPPTPPPPPPPTPAPAPGGMWLPKPGTSWQWQLSGSLDTSFAVQMYDIDLYETTAAQIAALHAQGRKVVCYFDTSYEPNRPDSTQLAPYRGNPMEGWPGQYWIDIRQPAVLDVMKNRLALAQQKACDGVEADDVDARSNNPGFPITGAEQQAFIRALAADAHARGMSFGLKNDLDEIPQLLADVDFAVNEECFQYNECSALSAFINAGKAVFQVEYASGDLAAKGATICPKANALNFDTLIKRLDLDPPRYSCR